MSNSKLKRPDAGDFVNKEKVSVRKIELKQASIDSFVDKKKGTVSKVQFSEVYDWTKCLDYKVNHHRDGTFSCSKCGHPSKSASTIKTHIRDNHSGSKGGHAALSAKQKQRNLELKKQSRKKLRLKQKAEGIDLFCDVKGCTFSTKINSDLTRHVHSAHNPKGKQKISERSRNRRKLYKESKSPVIFDSQQSHCDTELSERLKDEGENLKKKIDRICKCRPTYKRGPYFNYIVIAIEKEVEADDLMNHLWDTTEKIKVEYYVGVSPSPDIHVYHDEKKTSTLRLKIEAGWHLYLVDVIEHNHSVLLKVNRKEAFKCEAYYLMFGEGQNTTNQRGPIMWRKMNRRMEWQNAQMYLNKKKFTRAYFRGRTAGAAIICTEKDCNIEHDPGQKLPYPLKRHVDPKKVKKITLQDLPKEDETGKDENMGDDKSAQIIIHDEDQISVIEESDDEDEISVIEESDDEDEISVIEESDDEDEDNDI